MLIYNDGFDRRVKLLGELTALSYDGDSATVGNSLSSFMLFPDASTVYNNDVKITRRVSLANPNTKGFRCMWQF